MTLCFYERPIIYISTQECSDVADLRDSVGFAAIDIAIKRELHYCAMVLSAYVNVRVVGVFIKQ